jgi:hypothetical protein
LGCSAHRRMPLFLEQSRCWRPAQTAHLENTFGMGMMGLLVLDRGSRIWQVRALRCSMSWLRQSQPKNPCRHRAAKKRTREVVVVLLCSKVVLAVVQLLGKFVARGLTESVCDSRCCSSVETRRRSPSFVCRNRHLRQEPRTTLMTSSWKPCAPPALCCRRRSSWIYRFAGLAERRGGDQ